MNYTYYIQINLAAEGRQPKWVNYSTDSVFSMLGAARERMNELKRLHGPAVEWRIVKNS